MRMKTFYWLEIWVDPTKHKKVKKVMGDSSKETARSILKLFPSEQDDSPQWYELQQYLELLEDKYEKLDDLGVKRSDISVWMNCAYEDNSCEINFDPVTLLRFGEEEIKPCITCWKGEPWSEWIPESNNQLLRSVEITDLEIEKHQTAAGHKAEVTISLSDGSIWSASFITFNYMRKALTHNRLTNGSPKGHYFWEHDMILVDKLSRKLIEQVIVDLLNQRTFENAFSRLDIPDKQEAESGLSIIELCIIHERDQPWSIQKILGINEPYILDTPNFWSLKKLHEAEKPYVDYISYFLDILENKYHDLSKVGIRRQDISINLTYQYEGYCNLEFRPEVLERLGKNGISLSLTCQQAATNVVRCLE